LQNDTFLLGFSRSVKGNKPAIAAMGDHGLGDLVLRGVLGH
jgi:hypothetical protein